MSSLSLRQPAWFSQRFLCEFPISFPLSKRKTIPMAVGEAFLSAFLQVLFDKLLSPTLLSFLRQEGIEKKLLKWSKKLSIIQAVIDDAEEKRLTSRAAKTWLQDLRDLSYDMEDVVDELATEALGRDQTHNILSKISKHLPSRLANLSLSALKFSARMQPAIRDITSRLQDITESIAELGLVQLDRGGKMSRKVMRQRAPSTCLPYEPAGIFGRDEDKKRIIELVLRDELCDTNFSVIPIVGMGGVGKTTLARLVYNDKEMEHFDLKAWVCVSDDFDVIRITKVIIEAITSQSCDLKEFNQLQIKLNDELQRKKFLIVMDDVWDKNYGDWDALRSPFKAGAPGSKIIMTTRSRDVAYMAGTDLCYDLELLPDDACWSIFLQHAFDRKNSNELQNLEPVCQKVVNKCLGLPLAARTLGGLLRSKPGDEWEQVLSSRLWDLSESECDILPVLRLSYFHLPSELKRCFAYCALFPKGYEFKKEDIVILWMAEGLITAADENKQMEDIGCEYFDHMLLMSLFQPSGGDDGDDDDDDYDDDLFVMHDLVNDLAQWAAGEMCFRVEDESGSIEGSKLSRKARHVSFVCGNYDRYRKFKAFSESRRLRTFLSISYDDTCCCFLSNKVVEMLPELRCLRVLSLRGYTIIQLPGSIDNLKHLRYLDLSGTYIRSLPESTCSLYNLQVLKLNDCRFLERLPTRMENLINLRFLDFTNASKIKEMPLGIHKLKKLIVLSDFVVGKGSGSRIAELKNLRFIQGSLCISSLENVTDARDAREASLNDKEKIDELLLEWDSQFDGSRNGDLERDVLGMLHLIGMGIRNIGPEFYGENNSKPFPSLESLHINNMKELENWIPCQINQAEFLLLNELSIAACPKLTGNLPSHLPSLQTLNVNECEQFLVSLPSLPKLCSVEIKRCKKVENRSDIGSEPIKSVVLSNVSKLEVSRRGLITAEELQISGCEELMFLWQDNNAGLLKELTSLRYLLVESCPQLVSLLIDEESIEEEQLQKLRLETLRLKDCKSVERLPQWLLRLKSLKQLEIEDCPSVAAYPESFLPSMIREILIKNCDALCPLLEAVTTQSSSHLRRLSIAECDSLKSLGRWQFPRSLKVIEITSCKNLQFLLDGEMVSLPVTPDVNINSDNHSSSLFVKITDCPSILTLSSQGKLPASFKFLHVKLCPELISLTSGGNSLMELQGLIVEECSKLELLAERLDSNMPLRSIEIEKCENLKSLPDGLYNLKHLSEIRISDCRGLLSFPKGGLPHNNLKSLFICNCEKLKELPDNIHRLTSLEELEISNCPGIISLPKNGFPTNLKSLNLTNLRIYMPMSRWGLYMLISLRHLTIIGGCPDLVSFPEEEMQMALPTSLIHLNIGDFPNLKRLSSKGFQKLSLLQHLIIHGCPKLASLPEKCLPPSLLQLIIDGCPLLKERCMRDTGQEWSKIADIPCVFVDNTSAFHPGMMMIPYYLNVRVRYDLVL
ncbi:putative disease resistance protein At3g14460 [Carica papaya]|uniref:putative disease resistance protein At3g14460 n=1 Tax=Carica papaya TaxID=3649 RepID=UPI000B8CD54B|nr:putative disease resistance protein At3g14460 [Carica papaya]